MEEIAQVYSRSLFEVAKEHGKLDLVQASSWASSRTPLEQNRELAIFFFSPYFSTEEKKQGLERAVEGADPELMNFLELLIENHRMPVLFRARRQFEVLWDHEHRLLPVEVTSSGRARSRR